MSSSTAASPGHPAAGEAYSQAGPDRLPPRIGFLWAWQSPTHSLGSSCPDPHRPPGLPRIFSSEPRLWDLVSPTLSFSSQLCHSLRLPPWWPQWVWLPSKSQIAMVGPVCGHSHKLGIPPSLAPPHPLASVFPPLPHHLLGISGPLLPLHVKGFGGVSLIHLLFADH